MIIKINNQSIHPEENGNNQFSYIDKQINHATLRGQNLPTPNYFTILHHIINRNTSIRQVFKKFNQDYPQRCTVTIKQRGCDLKNDLKLSKAKSFNDKSLLSLTQISQSFRYSYRPKWKDSILRRKNNGVNGKIIKGKSQNHYSCIISRLQTQLEEPPREIQYLSKTKFSPLGKLYPRNIKFTSTQSKNKQPTILNRQSYILPEKPNKNQKIKNSKKQKNINKKLSSNYLNKTCIPLNNSLNNESLVFQQKAKKNQLSKPAIFLPRGFTPRPWETFQT